MDYFNISGGTEFQELELELEHGKESDLIFLSELVQNEMNLEIMYKQKYGRVIESLL